MQIQLESCFAENFVALMLSRLPLHWLWRGLSCPVSSRGRGGNAPWRVRGSATAGVRGSAPEAKCKTTFKVACPLERRMLSSRSLVSLQIYCDSCFHARASISLLERTFWFRTRHIESPLERQFPRSSGPRDFRFYKFTTCSKSRITSPDLLLGF